MQMRKTPVSRKHLQIDGVDAVLHGMTNMSEGSKQAIKTAVGHLNDISRKRTQRHTKRREIRGASKDIQEIKRDINRNGGSKDLKMELAKLRSHKKKLTIQEAKFRKEIKDLKKDFKHHLDDENNRSIKGTIFKKGTIKSDKTSQQDLLFALETLRRQKCTTDKQLEDRNALLAQMNQGLRRVIIPSPNKQSEHANLKKFIQDPNNDQPAPTSGSRDSSKNEGVTGLIIDPKYRNRSGKKTIKRKVDTSNLSQKDVNELLDKYQKQPGCTVTRWYEGDKLKFKMQSDPGHTHCSKFLNELESLNNQKKKDKKASMNLNKTKNAEMGLNPTQPTQGQIVENPPAPKKSTSRLSAKRKRFRKDIGKHTQIARRQIQKKRRTRHRTTQRTPALTIR